MNHSSQQMNYARMRRAVAVCAGVLVMTCLSTKAQETLPVGKTKEAQQRNAALLDGYNYAKYATSLTGYTGQDLQRVAFLQWHDAIRTRVGPRGNYKAGMTRLLDGKLVLAACRDNRHDDPAKRYFGIYVYESSDQGLTWKEIGQTPLYGKEPSLTTLPDGSILLTAQLGYFGPAEKAPDWAKKGGLPVYRSTDNGKTWETTSVPGGAYPRNVIVEPDGSLLMILVDARPNLQLCRSKDGGRTWVFSEGLVDWDGNSWYGEISAIRLKSGRLLAALRRQVPKTKGEGFEDTVITESTDDGKHWSKPRQLLTTAEVHAYLTELEDGRILATYSNYHLPWGVFAVVSEDGGKTWDLERPIQLALSADFYVGWPVTLQLPDKSLVTSYALTAYKEEPPKTTACDVVRWWLPK